MTKPRISIVTPCLNAATTIGRTLDSVRSQGYPDLQHLVIDGGSTDGTLALLAKHDDLVVVSERDEGLSDALNKGLALADGDIIGWLNADDLYRPGALDAVAAAFLRAPTAGWITGHCGIIGADDEPIRPFVTRYKSFFLRHYSYRLLLTQNFVSAPATFLTRRGFTIASPANLEYRYSMDYDLWLRVGRAGRPTIVDQELAAFRMIDGTLSMTGFERQFREHAEIARLHARGAGDRVAALVNRLLSVGIVTTYHAMGQVRRRSAAEA